jgi:hypothetical protein
MQPAHRYVLLCYEACGLVGMYCIAMKPAHWLTHCDTRIPLTPDEVSWKLGCHGCLFDCAVGRCCCKSNLKSSKKSCSRSQTAWRKVQTLSSFKVIRMNKLSYMRQRSIQTQGCHQRTIHEHNQPRAQPAII